MAGEVSINVVGNLTRDPELRQAGNAPVAGFAIAVNERKFNRDSNQWEDGATQFFECSAWRELGQNVAASLKKGMQVIVQGNLKQRSYEKDGQPRTVVEIEVLNIGPNLGKQVAQVQKVQPQNQQAPQQGYAQGGPVAPQGYPQPGYPQQVPGYPTPQGYPAPGGGYQAPVGPGGQPMPQQPAYPQQQPGYQHPTDPNTPF